MPGTRFRLTGGLWSSGHYWIGKGSTGRGTSSGGGHCGGSGLFALRGLPQDASPRSPAQHRAHSPGSEGRAMGVGCRAGAQVPRQTGRTGQRLQCTDACADERVELDPTRPRLQPRLPGRSPQLPGTELSASQQGPGGRAGGGGARAACAAGSRTTWRTRSYPRRWAALPAGNLSTRARRPPCPRPEASPAPPGLRGAATQSGIRCQPGYPLCVSLPPAQLHAAPQGVCRPPPLPTRTFPKTRFWRLSSPPGHLL